MLVNISKPWGITDDMVMYGHVCHFQPWSLKILLFGHQTRQWKSPIDQMFLNVSFMGHQPQAFVGRLNLRCPQSHGYGDFPTAHDDTGGFLVEPNSPVGTLASAGRREHSNALFAWKRRRAG